MSSTARATIRWVASILLVAHCVAAVAHADNDPAVLRGLQFLRSKAGGAQVGESALIALALLKSDFPAGDPTVAQCIAKVRTRCSSGVYNPERREGADIYEAAVAAMALSNLDAEARKADLAAIATYLLGKQNANGSWDYPRRPFGDTSISQYALLGLWEAENGGADVKPEVWDRAAQWYMSSQSAAGSWNYHRDEPQQFPETVAMTAAGVSSLLICQRQLARYRKGGDTTSALLTPLVAEGQRDRFDPAASTARINQAVHRGIGWLSANFSALNNGAIGSTPYYALYGIERIGALADRETLGKVDWFEQGRRFILSQQRSDGAWDAAHGDVPNTSWAILFINKSTSKTIRRIVIKQLGAGTLLGGRGLPKNLENLTVAGGRVVSRPMNGAVEGMLAVLEDPRAESADSALSGLVGRYRTDGPNMLRTHKDRFRKLLGDRDPGLRKVAAWALARTADLDVVPALIDALGDNDESVVTVAREGLQLLSRKINGLGPPPHATLAERQEAAKRWRAWYATIRPLDLEGQDDDETTSPVPASAARSPR
jgi:hypothetical protein